jgi:hypothetical protein
MGKLDICPVWRAIRHAFHRSTAPSVVMWIRQTGTPGWFRGVRVRPPRKRGTPCDSTTAGVEQLRSEVEFATFHTSKELQPFASTKDVSGLVGILGVSDSDGAVVDELYLDAASGSGEAAFPV